MVTLWCAGSEFAILDIVAVLLPLHSTWRRNDIVISGFKNMACSEEQILCCTWLTYSSYAGCNYSDISILHPAILWRRCLKTCTVIPLNRSGKLCWICLKACTTCLYYIQQHRETTQLRAHRIQTRSIQWWTKQDWLKSGLGKWG